jgi:hypothetical protein
MLLFATSASAQNVFSFDDIPIENEPTIEVDLGPEMLNLLGEASKNEGGEAGVALEGVTNVRVRMYEDIDADMREVLSFVDATARRLDADGWHAVVRIRDGNEQIRVYMKPDTGGKLAGVTFMMTAGDGDGGGGEAMFINVAGAFHPAQLGQLAAIGGMAGGVIGVLGIVPGAAGGDGEESVATGQD